MPDGGWDWPKQGTADEANLSPAYFTQQHVSTWLWPGPRAQTGYEDLLGQTCGSQYSYLMLKKGFKQIEEISPFGTCLQTNLQKA